MEFDQFVVAVNSEQPDKMIAFYRDVVGLTVDPDFWAGRV